MDRRDNCPKALVFVLSAGSLLLEGNGKLKSKGSQIVKNGEPLLAILCERGKSDLRSKISLGPAFGDGLSPSYECNAELRFA